MGIWPLILTFLRYSQRDKRALPRPLVITPPVYKYRKIATMHYAVWSQQPMCPHTRPGARRYSVWVTIGRSQVRHQAAGCGFPSPLKASEVLLPSGLEELKPYAAFGGVAHFAGCQQVDCAITARVPVISGPSQSRTRQSFDTIAGSRLP